ncbi:hypothetical protein HDU82_004614 [Entophlyctis luteolus]|nr:hypothetical protein HDU82_004614 [Entophlyctis luteolus]
MDARLFMFADYTLNARAQACLFVRESLLGGNSANTASGGAVLRVKGTTRTAISGAVAAATGATTTDAEWMLLFPDEDTRAVWMRAVGRAVNNAIAAAEAAAAVAAVPVSFPPVPVVAKTPSSASSPGLSSATLRQRIIAAEDVEGTVQILTTPLPIQPPEMNRKIESARAAKMRLEYQEYLERQRSDDQVRKREQAVAERLAREELERGERLLKEERERELKVKAEGIRRAMKMI